MGPFVIAAVLFLIPGISHALPLAAPNTIVIDAGHEPDEGIGRPLAAAESAFCRKAAFALKELIEKENGKTITVIILSSAEKEPTQREKAAAANQANGKLFIAIHATAVQAAQLHGLGIYSPDPDDAPAKSWRAIPRGFLGKNRLLAEKVKTAMQAAYPPFKLFPAFAPLYFFHGIDMPAVAVEAPLPESPGAETEAASARLAQTLYSALAGYGRGE